jgi:hypothetical protein
MVAFSKKEGRTLELLRARNGKNSKRIEPRRINEAVMREKLLALCDCCKNNHVTFGFPSRLRTDWEL